RGGGAGRGAPKAPRRPARPEPGPHRAGPRLVRGVLTGEPAAGLQGEENRIRRSTPASLGATAWINWTHAPPLLPDCGLRRGEHGGPLAEPAGPCRRAVAADDRRRQGILVARRRPLGAGRLFPVRQSHLERDG